MFIFKQNCQVTVAQEWPCYSHWSDQFQAWNTEHAATVYILGQVKALHIKKNELEKMINRWE